MRVLCTTLASKYTFEISPVFYAIVEKMAPLHDGGKVAVDDAIKDCFCECVPKLEAYYSEL